MELKINKVATLPMSLFLIGLGILKLCTDYGALNMNSFTIGVISLTVGAAIMIILGIFLFKISVIYSIVCNICGMLSFAMISFSGAFLTIATVFNDTFFGLRDVVLEDLNLIWMIFGINITMYILWFGYLIKNQIKEVSESRVEIIKLYSHACLVICFELVSFILLFVTTLKLNTTNPEFLVDSQRLAKITYAMNVYSSGAMLATIAIPAFRKVMDMIFVLFGNKEVKKDE